MNINDFFKDFAGSYIKSLENGVVPWQRTWDKKPLPEPINALTGRPYTGMNAFNLGLHFYNNTGLWMTYKQAGEIGANVIKGSKGYPIIFVGKFDKLSTGDIDDKNKTDRNISDSEDKPKLLSYLKVYYVFSIAQLEKVPEEILNKHNLNVTYSNTAIESIIKNSGATIIHSGNAPCYNPVDDKIHMPPKASFHTEEHYYSALLHEFVHWTGHKNRLDRPIKGRSDERNYATEELVAEIGSFFLCNKLGVRIDSTNHNSYIASYLRILKNDPDILLSSIKEAYKTNVLIQKLQTQELDWNLEAKKSIPEVEDFSLSR